MKGFSKDLRILIYAKLDYVDQTMLRIVYNPNFKIPRYTHLLIKCAEFGYLDIIKRVKPNEKHMHLICEEAIKYGKIEILKWFNYKLFNEFNIELTVKFNQLEILEYLWEPRQYHEYLVQFYASKHGNMRILQWSLITKKHEWDRFSVMIRAIKNQHWEMLRWLAKYDPSLVPQITELVNIDL